MSFSYQKTLVICPKNVADTSKHIKKVLDQYINDCPDAFVRDRGDKIKLAKELSGEKGIDIVILPKGNYAFRDESVPSDDNKWELRLYAFLSKYAENQAKLVYIGY